MTVRLSRADLEQLDKSALRLLLRRQGDLIMAAEARQMDIARRISEEQIVAADYALLAAGVAGIVWGLATIATAGAAIAAFGPLVVGFFGVVGGADQINDRIARGRVLRAERDALESERRALVEDGELIAGILREKS